MIVLAAAAAGCGKDPEAATKLRPEESKSAAEATKSLSELPFKRLGAFEYEDKMKLPEHVTEWSGKRVRVIGFINPGRQVKNLSKFLLVKDLTSCCFGTAPKLNHYIDVKLKPGQTAQYSRDPVTVEGVIIVDDRWDGDWPLGLYWMENAEVVE